VKAGPHILDIMLPDSDGSTGVHGTIPGFPYAIIFHGAGGQWIHRWLGLEPTTTSSLFFVRLIAWPRSVSWAGRRLGYEAAPRTGSNSMQVRLYGNCA
jgi:hypothetical protein